MRSRMLALILGVALVATVAGTVFAQGRPAAETFGWPMDEWQAGVDALAAGPSAPHSKTLPSPKIVRRGPASSGAVALTFDDGYNVRVCARIADTLRRNDAVGTFFVNGQWIKREPNRWRRILAGMEIANHTRSHPDLTKVPHPVVINQIRSNEYLQEHLLGRPMLKVLRPPYGAYGERVGRIARSLGYDEIVLWSVDTGDWEPGIKPGRIVRAATGAPPGSIILLHCAREATAKAMPRIVRHYQRRGIDVAGLSTVLAGATSQPGTAPVERYGG